MSRQQVKYVGGAVLVITFLAIPVLLMFVGGGGSASSSSWTLVTHAHRKGSDLNFTTEDELTDEQATALFRKSRVLKRESLHPDGRLEEVIFYKWLKEDLPENWTLHKNVIYEWRKAELNKDFSLYSSEEDMNAGKNQWAFCNYEHEGVGAFRDCGKKEMTPDRYFGRKVHDGNVLRSVRFYVKNAA